MGSFRISRTQCCGVWELADISALPNSKAVVAQILSSINEMSYGWQESLPAFLTFSGVVGDRLKIYSSHYHANRGDNYGQALADYIAANDLGEVTASSLGTNYNGNTLRIWVWAPRWDALRQLWQETTPQRPQVIMPSAPSEPQPPAAVWTSF